MYKRQEGGGDGDGKLRKERFQQQCIGNDTDIGADSDKMCIRDRGIEQGIEQGEDRALLLMKKLLESDRMEDLQRALRDRDYQKKLMKELNIL